MSDPNGERQAINDIFRLINSGQIEHAEERCRAYIEKSPDDINVLGLLGAVLLKLGRVTDAKPILERTIQLEPAFAKPYEDLGMLYLHRDDPNQAAQYFADAIRLDGNQASAYSGLAEALMRLGKDEQAAAARQKYLKLSPVAQALAQAGRLLEAGNTAQAEQLCEKVLKQHPTNIDILRLLARIASEDKRYVVAEGLLKRIIKLSAKRIADSCGWGVPEYEFIKERDTYSKYVDKLSDEDLRQGQIANAKSLDGLPSLKTPSY